jgi:hypothetical protein
MSFWDILDTLLDLFFDWRFHVCFWGGLILALFVAEQISYEPLAWIVGGLIFVTGVVVGYRWENSD